MTGDEIDLDALIRPERVHRRLYTDPAVFELEMARLFGRTWVYLAHSSQLPAAGDFVQVRVGRRPVLVTRDESGSLHALLNRCTHRGTVLEVAGGGCAKRFTCPYHGWTFANDGRLIGVPYPGNYSNLDRSALGLGKLTVGEHRGFVFGTLAPSPEPLDAWLGPASPYLDQQIDRHPGGTIQVLPSSLTLEYRGNWKLAWDNAADGLHANFAHESYNALGRAADTTTVLQRDPASTAMFATLLGRGHVVVDQRPGLASGTWDTLRPLPFSDGVAASIRAAHAGDAADFLDVAAGSMVNLSLFPNLIFVGNQLMVVDPVEVDRTHLHLFLLAAGDGPPAINLMRLRVDEDFVSFGTPDDLAMFERIQEGLSIPEMEWIDTSRGLGSPTETHAPDGLHTSPITSEAAIRSYYDEYRRLVQPRAGTGAHDA